MPSPVRKRVVPVLTRLLPFQCNDRSSPAERVACAATGTCSATFTAKCLVAVAETTSLWPTWPPVADRARRATGHTDIPGMLGPDRLRARTRHEPAYARTKPGRTGDLAAGQARLERSLQRQQVGQEIVHLVRQQLAGPAVTVRRVAFDEDLAGRLGGAVVEVRWRGPQAVQRRGVQTWQRSLPQALP